MQKWQKYREALLIKIREQMEIWMSVEVNTFISQEEVYRFLHSIQGTSGTIGMNGLFTIAKELNEINKKDSWEAKELINYLVPLVMESYTYQENQEMLLEAKEQKVEKNANQSLVLIFDEDILMLHTLKEVLEKEGYFVIATPFAEQAVHYFHDMNPECLITDVQVFEKSDEKIMGTLKNRIKHSFIPMIMTSVDRDKEKRLKAFEIGAGIFFHKPIDTDELLVWMKSQIQLKKQLDHLLFIDELTGVMNRKSLYETYKQLRATAKRMNKIFSVVVLDIDRFKLVNDTYGHLVGDVVLKRFSEFVRSNIRTTDVFARYGGEEFILLLPKTEGLEAQILLERILHDFSKVEFEMDTGILYVTFSAGIVEVDDLTESDLKKWIELADIALYRAKRFGRSRIEISNIHSESVEMIRKINLAIIDDDVIIRALLSETIQESLGKHFSLDIRTFQSGQAFFKDEWHKEQVPFIVILDGVMPEMDGLDVLTNIRKLPQSDSYSVIMLTGRGLKGDILKALELGADDYLTKPFLMEELEVRIGRLLQRVRK